MFNTNIHGTQHIPGLFETSIFKLTKQHRNIIKERNPNLCECGSCGARVKRPIRTGLQVLHHHNEGVKVIVTIICVECAKAPEAAISNALEDLCKRTGKPLNIYGTWKV